MAKRFKRICALIVTCFLFLFTVTACGDKAITSLEIKAGTFAYTYEKGQDVSLEDLVVIVKYNDETKIEVEYGDENLTVTGLTTATTGKKEVTITYMEKSVTIEVTVVNPSPGSAARNLIAALPDVNDITLDNKNAVAAARTAYNMLTSDSEKAKVTNLDKLVAAEAKIAELDFAAYKVAKKAELANYKNLNNYNTTNQGVIQGYITTANNAIDAATDAATVDAAVATAKTNINAVKVVEITNVEDLIAALPEASEVELEDKTAIQAARSAYDAISTAANKALVSNYSKLTAAEEALVPLMDFAEIQEDKKAELTNYKSSTSYNPDEWEDIQDIIDAAHTAIENATTAQEVATIVNNAKADIDEVKVKEIRNVELAIENLPEVEQITLASDRETIEDIRSAYNSLSDEVQAKVSNISVLVAAEAKILDLYKVSKTAEFEKYLEDNNVVEGNYSSAKWETVSTAITNCNSAINAATSITEVDEVIAEAKVSIEAVTTVDEDYKVIGWDAPKGLDDRTANLSVASTAEAGFNNKDNIYVVGDDNPFIFLPDITVVDKDNKAVEEVFDGYSSKVTVYMSETKIDTFTNDHLLTGTDLTYYVDVDEYSFSFDFKETAIGKYFRIEVLPLENPLSLSAQALNFKVVDGYNVTQAKELGVLHNYDRDDGELIEAWDEFLNNNGIYNPTNVNGIVLHNNIKVYDKDIPVAFFDESGKLIDYSYIYDHSVPVGSEFNFYGNYFSVDAENISYIDKETADGHVSHSALFKINNGSCRDNVECTFAENTYANFYDVSFKGNANKDTANDGFAGLMMGKFTSVTTTFDNVLIRCFYINTFIGSDDERSGVVNMNNVKSYDAFQNIMYVWGGHTVNITSSEMKRSGGPTIIAQHVKPHENTTSFMPIINISEDTDIEVYLAGNENWFSYLELTPLASVIKALDASLYENTGSTGFVGLAGTTNSAGVSVLGKMNIVAVLMSDTNGQSSAIETQGLVTINNAPIADLMNESSIIKNNPQLYGIYTTNVAGMTPPVMVTDSGAIATSTDGTTVTPITQNMAQFGQGKYITIYQGGMAIILSHNINPAKVG